MYENHFSIKLISIENLYIMTTMSQFQKVNMSKLNEHKFDEEVKFYGEIYVKKSTLVELSDFYYAKLLKRDAEWTSAYNKLDEASYKDVVDVAKLKSIITDYENKITRYIDKIDEQEAIILTMTSEPVIECELETKKCNGLKCKGQFQPLELFMKNGKTLKNCKICRDHKCELDKKSRKKPRYIDMYELD